MSGDEGVGRRALSKEDLARRNLDKSENWKGEWRRGTIWKSRRSPELFGFEYHHKGQIVADPVVVLSCILESGPFHYLKGVNWPERASRNIQLDRIIRAWIVGVTGHIVDPKIYFTVTLPSITATDPVHDAALSKSRTGLAVLAWIARAEPSLAASARPVMVDFVSARSGTSGRSAINEMRAEVEIAAMKVDAALAQAAAGKTGGRSKERAILSSSIDHLATIGGAAVKRRADQARAWLGPGGG